MAPVLLTPTNQLPLKSNITRTLLLDRCSNSEELKQIHTQLLKTGRILDPVPVSKLLALCTSPESGDLAYADKVFAGISKPNTYMWNTMIRGYSNGKNPIEALLLYIQMLYHSVPHNAYTFPFLLKACSSLSALEETQQIHAHIIKTGFNLEIYATNSLIHAYAKSSRIKSAHLLFNRVLHRDIVSWNSIIDGYMKSGCVEMAYEIFKIMPEKNIVSWTTMISGYVEAGLYREAMNLFHEMQVLGIEPDKVALASIISACANLAELNQGIWIHAYIEKKKVQIDPILGCVLIDMYAKCGDFNEALEVFKKVDKKGVSVWTAMIDGLAIHGRGREALDLFHQMQKRVKPNSITFTAILTACSHGGLINQGKSIFKSMKSLHNLNPSIEHYGCMVDLFGRAGFLEEAEELIEKMPMKPNAAIWGALLNACQLHRNIKIGKKFGTDLIEMDPSHGGRYIQLMNINALEGEWGEAVKVRHKMKERGVLKIPGLSLIRLNGITHEFIAGDVTHPRINEINRMCDQIMERLKQEGYDYKCKMGDLLLE